MFTAQELCESWGGPPIPNTSSSNSPEALCGRKATTTLSVDVMQHWTNHDCVNYKSVWRRKPGECCTRHAPQVLESVEKYAVVNCVKGSWEIQKCCKRHLSKMSFVTLIKNSMSFAYHQHSDHLSYSHVHCSVVTACACGNDWLWMNGHLNVNVFACNWMRKLLENA